MSACRFNPISFNRWQQNEIENKSAEDMVDCPECEGSGYVDCDCCGNEAECEDCEGGEVKWSELTDAEKRRHLNRDRYARAVLADANAFANWLDRDPVETLVNAGFRVSMDVRSRRLHVEAMEGTA